jgi:hypothetical protein
MKKALPWLLPLALVPPLVAGLWLWDRAGALIWISAFVASCF